MSDIIRRDPRAEWIARNRLHPLHAAMQTQQTRWMGPNGLIRKNPHALAAGFIGPAGLKRIDAVVPSRVRVSVGGARQRPRCSCRCTRYRHRRFISPWCRTWSVVA